MTDQNSTDPDARLRTQHQNYQRALILLELLVEA